MCFFWFCEREAHLVHLFSLNIFIRNYITINLKKEAFEHDCLHYSGQSEQHHVHWSEAKKGGKNGFICYIRLNSVITWCFLCITIVDLSYYKHFCFLGGRAGTDSWNLYSFQWWKMISDTFLMSYRRRKKTYNCIANNNGENWWLYYLAATGRDAFDSVSTGLWSKEKQDVCYGRSTTTALIKINGLHFCLLWHWHRKRSEECPNHIKLHLFQWHSNLLHLSIHKEILREFHLVLISPFLKKMFTFIFVNCEWIDIVVHEI